MKAAHKKLTITLVIAVAVIVLTPAVGLTRAETEGRSGVVIDFGYWDTVWVNLDFGDGMIGQLEIPTIHVSLPITHSGADIRPDRELVHVDGSSLPGETGYTHTVLAGP